MSYNENILNKEVFIFLLKFLVYTSLIFLICYFYVMYLSILSACLDRYYIYVLPVEARSVSDPLELGLQMVVPPHSDWELNPGPLPPHS